MWRRIWGPTLADSEHQRALNYALTRHFIGSSLFLDRLLGDYGCGLVALESYFDPKGNHEVTADYVSHRLGGYMSEDTARRKLYAMVKLGTLKCRKEGRTVHFSVTDDIAHAAIAHLRGEPVIIPATKPQNAINM